MTLIVARKFGDRMIVASETMISDQNAWRADIIPGALKTVILTLDLSVSYAGDMEWAMMAIRQVSRTPAMMVDKQALLQHLQQFTINDRCEFIVAFHAAGSHLRKIWCGNISGDLEDCSISNRAALSDFDAYEAAMPTSDQPDKYETENRFVGAWTGWQQEWDQNHYAIGGFFLTQLCSPRGYCYNNAGSVYNWDMVNLSISDTKEKSIQRAEDHDSGLTQYTYQIAGPNARGVAIFGAYMPQPRTGFIYSPLIAHAPVSKLNRIGQSEFFSELNRIALAAGGVEVD
jgi:hypothetical protein